MPIWMMPSQSIGFSPEHQAFPGTLSLSADVLLSLVTDVGQQIASMGFKRLVFFNAHGGQIGLLQAVSRQLRIQCPSSRCIALFPLEWCPRFRSSFYLKKKLRKDFTLLWLKQVLCCTWIKIWFEMILILEKKEADQEIISAPKGWSLEGASPCAWHRRFEFFWSYRRCKFFKF